MIYEFICKTCIFALRMSSLNRLIEMDHEVGKSTSPPKLLKVADYPSWKERFENFARFNDIRVWICITDGYVCNISNFRIILNNDSYHLVVSSLTTLISCIRMQWIIKNFIQLIYI